MISADDPRKPINFVRTRPSSAAAGIRQPVSVGDDVLSFVEPAAMSD
ncbi:MAG: hypothetical protein K0S56_2401 [Microvirga sp.]|nr:hypothetical protein [Microvirga sp.]